MIVDFQMIESIAVSLSVIASLYIFWRTPKYSNIRARYDKLIFPLFQLIEPYLFTDYSKVPITDIVDFIEQNAVFAGSRINECTFYLKENCNQYNFNRLCHWIYFEYNSSSFILGLRVHSMSYRLNRHQYETKFLFFIYMFLYIFLLLICLCFAITLLIAVIFITQRLRGI